MDTEQLKTFVEVVRLGSFAAVAREFSTDCASSSLPVMPRCPGVVRWPVRRPHRQRRGESHAVRRRRQPRLGLAAAPDERLAMAGPQVKDSHLRVVDLACCRNRE